MGFRSKRGERSAFTVVFMVISALAMGLGQPVAAQERMPQATIPGKAVGALYLPWVGTRPQPEPEREPNLCPTLSERTFQLIPVDGAPADHPDELHGDLNLALRGSVPVAAALSIVDVNGPTDPNAPQLFGLFGDGRMAQFSSTHRVYDWDWSCGEHGCRSPDLTARDVSLLGMATAAGEAIAIPSRAPEIYGGGYTAMVLYAAETRITLGYTRVDSVAPGYAVHIEELCVDPNLLALYRQANRAGRSELPALHNGDVVGAAIGNEILAAVRDRGTFMEPRSRKDWWKGR